MEAPHVSAKMGAERSHTNRPNLPYSRQSDRKCENELLAQTDYALQSGGDEIDTVQTGIAKAELL
jgi:hypothetical protein